jgi:hypothetical protein
MYKKILLLLSALVIAALSACGPEAPPTLSPAEIEGTAVALAWTSFAQTQTAQPTLTPSPIPPTETPLPTVTPFPTLPPLQPTVALAAVTPTGNPCYNPPPPEPVGTTVLIRIVNNSQGIADFNFGMENANDKGECATYYVRLGRYDQPVVRVLAACYWGLAYITDPNSVSKTIAPLCLFDTAKTVPVSVGPEVIGLQ